MARSNGPSFVIEFPLAVEKWQDDLLCKTMEHMRKLYNHACRKFLGQYKQITQQKNFKTEYKEYQEKYREKKKIYDKKMKAASDEEKKILKKERPKTYWESKAFSIDGIDGVTLTEYGIMGYVSKLAQSNLSPDKRYADIGINSIVALQLGVNLWAAFEKLLYGKGERVRYKRFESVNSITSRRQGHCLVGFNVDLDKRIVSYKIRAKNKNDQYIHLKIKTDKNKPFNEYEAEALSGGADSIKVITIVRRFIRGMNKYFVQFTVGGHSPSKGRELGSGKVGVDLGTSTVAVSAKEGVRKELIVENLLDEIIEVNRKIEDVDRKMERSRRQSNPQNFNENGTIKKGRRKWNYSKNYSKLKSQKRSLSVRMAAKRKLSHNILANSLLGLGDTFIIENNDVKEWQQEHGKSIGNCAPSAFSTILANKVSGLGGKFIKVSTHNAASQYDFNNGVFTPHDLTVRRITLSTGIEHDRDMLAAFNLQHLECKKGVEECESADKLPYEVGQMREDYKAFCEMEEKEMESWREKEEEYFHSAAK